MPRINVGIGDKYGILTIIGAGKNYNYRLVQCECGVIKETRYDNMRRGHTKSCGCLRNQITHTKTHNMTKSREYICWKSMKSRCKRDPYYVKEGIKVHPHFEKFENFYEHIGDKPTPEHTLDRIDNSKGYEPGNIRWATWAQQNQNKGTTG